MEGFGGRRRQGDDMAGGVGHEDMFDADALVVAVGVLTHGQPAGAVGEKSMLRVMGASSQPTLRKIARRIPRE